MKRGLVEELPGECDADTVADPLTQRAAGDVDPRQHRCRVPLQARAEPTVAFHQFGVGDDADRLERGVQQRRRVPLGQDEMVVVRVVRLVPVTQVACEQNGHQVGRRHAGGGVPGAGGGAGADCVGAQLGGQLPDHRGVDASIGEFTQRKASSE